MQTVRRNPERLPPLPHLPRIKPKRSPAISGRDGVVVVRGSLVAFSVDTKTFLNSPILIMSLTLKRFSESWLHEVLDELGMSFSGSRVMDVVSALSKCGEKLVGIGVAWQVDVHVTGEKVYWFMSGDDARELQVLLKGIRHGHIINLVI